MSRRRAMGALGDALLPERLDAALKTWLPWQRWFAAKGRPIEDVEIVQATPFTAEGSIPRGLLVVVTVRFLDGGETERYQVPLGIRDTVPPALGPSVIAGLGDDVVYDALGDPALASALPRSIAEDVRRDGIAFVSEPLAPWGSASALGPGAPARSVGAEQSNTSVIIADRFVLKVFRRLRTGVNPDLELQRALRQAGSQHVAPLLGAIEGDLEDGPVTYGILQGFVANAADGWSMALASLRDLLADCTWPAGEVGGDFAPEAHRLGSAVAAVHVDLADEFGSSAPGPAERDALTASLRATLDEALETAPPLAPYAERARAVFDAVAREPSHVPAQRVHGDLHLGQVLRTPADWILIDFEGEPARPMAERTAPQSPLRDVAGMLRSFDYAAHHQLEAPCYASDDPATAAKAREWAGRNRAAFCTGYADVAGYDPREHPALLRAYELEKAVYETTYEIRNRPGWVSIPLSAVRYLATGEPAE